jgi:hypothetical protein
MKNPVLILSLLLSAGSFSLAAPTNTVDEFTTLTGRTYRQCRISQVHPDGVSFFHSKGAAKVLFADLSDSWKKKLGYNPKLAEAYEKEAATKKFLAQERLAKAREEWAAQQRQDADLRLRILERAFEFQTRQQLLQQQQLAAYYGTQVPVTGPAPAIGWPGTYYGPLNSIYGPSFGGPSYGGHPWNNCGSITLASIGGGSGGYLGLNSRNCVWAGHGRVWNYPVVVNSPTLGAYLPGRFAPFGTTGPFGGVYLGGARNLGQVGLGSVAYGFLPPAAPVAPVFRGSVSVSAPAP